MTRHRLSACVFALLTAAMAGCSTQTVPEHILTVNVQPEGAGAVTMSPFGDSHRDGASVELSAVASEGHLFKSWIEDGKLAREDQPYTVILRSDRTITALFETAPDIYPGYGSSSLPRFIISLQGNTIVNEPKVPARLLIEVAGERLHEGQIGIEYRGSSSYRLFEKKSYGVETWDGQGGDAAVSLLGLPQEEDWILYGPYSDKTLMRNVIMMGLSNDMGRYASRTRFVDLEIDGRYDGVYVLMEKIKRDRHRVDIRRLDPQDTDAEAITGGYILKIDKTTGDTADDDWSGDAIYTESLGFRSAYSVTGALLVDPPFGPKRGEETYFLYEYPDADEITSEQKAYIQGYVHAFETSLLNDAALDASAPRTYTDHIDLGSFVDVFILNELSHNADAYRLSTFLHKERGGKLAMGPIWDFNLSLGNDSDAFRRSFDTWIHQYNRFIPGDLWLVPFWWERLAEDPVFRAAVRERWFALRDDLLSDASLAGRIDAIAQQLRSEQAVDRNFVRWPILGQHVWGNGYVGADYDEDLAYMKDWLAQRTAWMDLQLSAW